MLHPQSLPFNSPIAITDNTISQSEPSLILQKDSMCSGNMHELWHQGAYVWIPARTAHRVILDELLDPLQLDFPVCQMT